MSNSRRTDLQACFPALKVLVDKIIPAKTKPGQIRAARYPDMQSAVRFPIKLPISVKSKAGESHTESENISSNGVLFEVDADMPVGSLVDFTISLPAEVVGARLRCAD